MISLCRKAKGGKTVIHNSASTMTDVMIKKKILMSEKRDYYAYILEVMIEKIITYSVLVIISIIMNVAIPTLFFMVFFFSLRERTGGFHFNSFLKCLISTLIIYLLMNTVLITFFLSHENSLYVTLGISVLIIMYIANVNNPNLGLDEEEILDCKKSARYIVIVEMLCIISGIALRMNKVCIIYESLAIIMCAVLLSIAKLKKQEVI